MHSHPGYWPSTWAARWNHRSTFKMLNLIQFKILIQLLWSVARASEFLKKKLSQVILLGNSGYDLLPYGKGPETLVHKRIIWRAFWNADSRASSPDPSIQQFEMEPKNLQFKKYSSLFWCRWTSDLENHFLERFAIFMVLSFPTFKHGILAI